jgi:alkylhydroperoxidase family enzyme
MTSINGRRISLARIPYPDPSQAPDGVRETLAAMPPLNIFRMLAYAETAFRPFVYFGGAILADLQLDPKLRELAILQVAKDSSAEYEWVQHVAIGLGVGLTDKQIAAVQRGDDRDPSLSDADRAVLRFAAEVIDTARVSDETFATVSRSLGHREIVELLLTIGTYLTLARVMTTLELEIDEAVPGQVLDSTQTLRSAQ